MFDVAVVGGGPAGLSAAMWCARYRRTVLLVDADEQRNSSAAETHGYLGLDGAEPAELVERAISDVLAYPEVTRIEGGSVTDVTVVDDTFDLRLADGRRMRALRLILATGVVDLLPDIAHFDEYYGRRPRSRARPATGTRRRASAWWRSATTTTSADSPSDCSTGRARSP